jgi:hypothetical protein
MYPLHIHMIFWGPHCDYRDVRVYTQAVMSLIIQINGGGCEAYWKKIMVMYI